MKLFKILYLTIFIATCKTSIYGQDSVSIMFYNVENLFDTFDDSTKNDNEFLPEAKKKWTKSRWHKKTQKIAQVITAANYPDVIGFCEIENDTVLKKLINSNLLWKEHYKILHFESKDQRGIDVAIIYKAHRLDLLSVKPHYVNLKGRRNTRDILSATFANETDTFALFVNHWPSRYGGQKKSIPKRLIASNKLKILMDSVTHNFSNRKVIAIGDFNDEPHDISLASFTNYEFAPFKFDGTIRYRGRWQKFDQFILSKKFAYQARILNFKFLLEEDKKYGGFKPYRTYIGPRYRNGFSDHLPILLRF